MNRVGRLAGPFRDLQHHRGFLLLAGLDDGLEQLHIIDIERAERVLAFERLGKQIFRVSQWHKFVSRQILPGSSGEGNKNRATATRWERRHPCRRSPPDFLTITAEHTLQNPQSEIPNPQWKNPVDFPRIFL